LPDGSSYHLATATRKPNPKVRLGDVANQSMHTGPKKAGKTMDPEPSNTTDAYADGYTKSSAAQAIIYDQKRDRAADDYTLPATDAGAGLHEYARLHEYAECAVDPQSQAVEPQHLALNDYGFDDFLGIEI